METTITVYHTGGELRLPRREGETLLEILQKGDGYLLDAPCGGKGTCGKCRIRHLSGPLSPPDEEELRLLSPEERKAGIRLACRTLPLGDGEIQIPDRGAQSRIQTAHRGYEGPLDPLARVVTVTLPPPSLEDQRDDLTRLLEALDLPAASPPLPFRRVLPDALRAGNFQVEVLLSGETPRAVHPAGRAPRCLGVAVDIGTTTVVAYLLDLATGETLDVISELNHQKGFGADVISRIDHAQRSEGGLEQLRRRILHQLDGMIDVLFLRNGLDPASLAQITLAGNTTMMHLAAGIPPGAIAQAPYIPGDTTLCHLSAEDFGFRHRPEPMVTLLPSLAGYVGADIVAGMLATSLHESEEPALLVDIGTNGEMVLATGENLLACSTAAGPALEGANISCGLGGVTGAVSGVRIHHGALTFDTIAEAPPAGICGSGIIDTLALLLEEELVDATGRLLPPEELSDQLRRRWGSYLEQNGEGLRFHLLEPPARRDVPFLGLTQKDIREIQLAKGAIGAGIRTLLNEAGLGLEDVKKVYLAGGFGSHMDQRSACRVGLLPREWEDRIHPVGNSAGLGAIMATLSRQKLDEAANLRNRVTYLELSGSSLFQQEYMMQMMME